MRISDAPSCSRLSQGIIISALGLLTVILFFILLCAGAVSIPLGEIVKVLSGKSNPDATESVIILQSRLPMAVAALVSGGALSVAGLLLQTTFRNPLAGPSILGVSSGASLGVAIIMLGASFFGLYSSFITTSGPIIGALAGAGGVIGLLLLFSSTLRNPVMLLIVGVMMSYLASSIISLLNFFAPSEDVKSFVIWGLGSFAGVRSENLAVFAIPLIFFILSSILLCKPLNALLLGERYAATMGYSLNRLRAILLFLSGILTAFVTAFCGPIGFIGLIVPHLARMLTGTSNHLVLLPATILTGSALMQFCSLCTVIPTFSGVLPINVVTPIVGVPVIFYIILNRHKLNYFN